MTAGPPPAPQQQFTLNDNDRVVAALGYVFWIVAVVMLILDDTKRKPLLRDHAVQGIGFAVVSIVYGFFATFIYICAVIISFGILAFFLWVIFLVPVLVGAYFGYLAYTRDGLVEIPLLTDFMAEQGWFQTRQAV
jgi:uncharacterized membrane protein